MDMELFYIVITIIFVALLIAALVLWIIDARMDYKRKKIIAQKIQSGSGMRLESDDLLLKVKNGVVEICEDVPVSAAPMAESSAPAGESAPVVPMPEETAAADAASVAAKEEQLEELVNRYGEITDNSVVFESNKNQKTTFVEKYAALDAQSRNRYDEIVAYILAHPDCRKSEASNAVTFKCKTDKIMRAVIKRGTVVLNFMLSNTDLNRFVREEGIKKIKIAPVVVRLESDIDLVLAKQTVDITLENIHEEQQYRKERKRELRRLSRKQKEETKAV